MKLVSVILLAALLTGCERAAFMTANAPLLFSQHNIERDIAYGEQAWQKLDIHTPASTSAAPRDVIVFFYGGRWTSGAKDDYRFVGKYFADAGYVVVIPDYAKYPQVRFPVFVEDGAKALSWVYDNIAQYHGDKTRIHVMGHSAGAHIGALLAADKKYLAADGKTPRDVIKHFVGLAGPYAFTPDEPDLMDMFKKPYAAMQVPSFIDGTEPPMLLLWGDADTDVGRFNHEKLEAKIKEKRGNVRSIIYPALDHIGVLKAFVWVDGDKAGIGKTVLDFMKQPSYKK